MAIPTFTPAKTPIIGTSTDNAYRVLEAGFGDGYSQVTIDGLNATAKNPTIQWAGLTLSQAQSIQAQFDTFAGTTFAYQVPGDTQARFYRCKGTKWDDSDGVTIAISAPLMQAYDLS